MAEANINWNALASEFFERRAQLSDQLRADAEARQSMGMAYVWGRQDAIADINQDDSERDSTRALAFSYAYGLHAIDYYTERTCLLRNVQDAYRRWSSGEPLTIERDISLTR